MTTASVLIIVVALLCVALVAIFGVLWAAQGRWTGMVEGTIVMTLSRHEWQAEVGCERKLRG
jgi:hypothetical protein